MACVYGGWEWELGWARKTQDRVGITRPEGLGRAEVEVEQQNSTAPRRAAREMS